MHFSSTLSAIALATLVSAKVVPVAVGQNGLTYTPSDIKADVGDTVEFTFSPKNHTVTQSSFAKPCVPLANGFFSSFVPVAAALTAQSQNSTFTISINDTKPIWLYCGQTTGSHCQAGMAASINAPSTGNTLAAFLVLAKNTTISSSPASGAVGGILKISGSGSAVTSKVESTTKTVTTTITAFVTTGATSYSTTYGTTYTTAVVVPASAVSSSSTTSSAAAKQSTAAAGEMVKAGGGVLGAAVVVAWALL